MRRSKGYQDLDENAGDSRVSISQMPPPQEIEMVSVSVVPDGNYFLYVQKAYHFQYSLESDNLQASKQLLIHLRQVKGPNKCIYNFSKLLKLNILFLFTDTFTVTQAVNALGFGWFQVKLSLCTGLCWMADSMEMTILSILSPALHCEWNISK